MQEIDQRTKTICNHSEAVSCKNPPNHGKFNCQGVYVFPLETRAETPEGVALRLQLIANQMAEKGYRKDPQKRLSGHLDQAADVIIAQAKAIRRLQGFE